MFCHCCSDHDYIYLHICVLSLLPWLWISFMFIHMWLTPMFAYHIYIPICMEVHCQPVLVLCVLFICSHEYLLSSFSSLYVTLRCPGWPSSWICVLCNHVLMHTLMPSHFYRICIIHMGFLLAITLFLILNIHWYSQKLSWFRSHAHSLSISYILMFSICICYESALTLSAPVMRLSNIWVCAMIYNCSCQLLLWCLTFEYVFWSMIFHLIYS